MELQDLRCLLAVAEERHFGRAAERLHLSQPTVSKAIRRIETGVGGPLFDRSSRPIEATGAGESFVTDVRAALDRLDAAWEAARAAQRDDAQQVRIGYTADVGATLVAGAIAAVHRKRPDLRILWMNEGTAAQVDAIRSGRLDAGIGWLPQLDASFEVAELASAGFVALVPEGHRLAGAGSAALDSLVADDFVLWPRGPNPELFDMVSDPVDTLGGNVVEAQIGIDDVAARVIAGAGIGVIPEGYAGFRPVAGVATVPIVEGLADVPLDLFWSSGSDDEGLQIVVELIRDLAGDLGEGVLGGAG